MVKLVKLLIKIFNFGILLVGIKFKCFLGILIFWCCFKILSIGKFICFKEFCSSCKWRLFFIWLSIKLVILIVGLKEIKLWVMVVIEVDNWLQLSISKIGKFSNWEIWVVEVKLGKCLLI